MESIKSTFQAKFDTLYPSNESPEYFINLMIENGVEDEDILRFNEDYVQSKDQIIAAIELMPDMMAQSQIINNLLSSMDLIIGYKANNFQRPTVLSRNLATLNLRASDLFNYMKSISFEQVVLQTCRDQEAIESLQHFIRTSEIIRSDTGTYAASISSKIESSLSEMVPLINSQDHPNLYHSSRAFIALAAPSLVGKTQLAFNLRQKLPFYFVLSEGTNEQTQSVYKNYISMSEKLLAFAEIDCNTVLSRYPRRQHMLLRGQTPDYSHFSADTLLNKFRETKFWTLGYLNALAKHARENFRPESSQVWMEYLSRGKSFRVEPMSISEFLVSNPDFSATYCVFLDEFREDFSSVFIRNILRAMNIKCLVSNTNTYIANLIGTTTPASRGDGLASVWALVICYLDPFNPRILDQIFDWQGLINSLSDAMSTECRIKFMQFIDHILSHQLRHIRPGIAIFFADALNALLQVPHLNELTTVDCIDLVVKYISNEIFSRKPRMFSQIGGQFGNFALHSSVAFNRDSRSVNGMNMKVFLEDHLFFLENPVHTTSWFFFLFREQDTGHLRIFLNGRISDWLELSYFRSGETLTLMAGLFGTLRKPAALLLKESRQKLTQNVNLNEFPNPRAKSKSGLELEISACVSVIEASHFISFPRNNEISSTFKGVPFGIFLQNVLRNVIESYQFVGALPLWKRKVRILFPSTLKLFIKNFIVPFLGPSNLSWPPELTFIFPLDSSQNTVKLGSYNRTSNNSGIDGIFDIIKTSPTMIEMFKGAVECKDWSNDLSATEIESIILKSLNQPSLVKFVFIFCNTIGGKTRLNPSQTSRIAALHTFLHNSMVNLYRFSPLSSATNSAFKIVPYRPETLISKNPSATVFIISKTDINNRFI
jgi:hypothetical protein